MAGGAENDFDDVVIQSPAIPSSRTPIAKWMSPSASRLRSTEDQREIVS
jgi:hypothetical protein